MDGIEINENNIESVLFGISTEDEIARQVQQMRIEEETSAPAQIEPLRLYIDGDFEHNRFFNHCYSAIITHLIANEPFKKFCTFCLSLSLKEVESKQKLMELGSFLYSSFFKVLIFPWEDVCAEWLDWMLHRQEKRSNIYSLHINKISPYIQADTFDKFIAIAKKYVIQLDQNLAVEYAKKQYEYFFAQLIVESEKNKTLPTFPPWDEKQFVEYFYEQNPPEEIVLRRKELIQKRIHKKNLKVIQKIHKTIPTILDNDNFKALNSVTASMQRLVNSNNSLNILSNK